MARYTSSVCCMAYFVAISLTVVLAKKVYLAHECVTVPSEGVNKLPVIMLHGLTDVKETWDSIYPSVSYLTDRRICTYDARNHGDSGWNDTLNVDVLAEDLGHFMEDMKIEKASLVGHSMGGLTVMKFSLKNPEKVESIFVEDITPNSVTKEGGENFKKIFRIVLDSLSAIPVDADEETALKAVKEYIIRMLGIPLPEHLFKIYPLRCQNDVWQWKANYEAFIKAFEEEGVFLGKLEGRYDGPAFFIYGTVSPFKVNENEEDIKKLFPKAEFYGVEGADHNVHGNTTIYINKLVHFLNNVSQKSDKSSTL